jgi:gamma-glutamylcyclotransferase (GGCT)/AIG2-like uncharacterized protein YtfP
MSRSASLSQNLSAEETTDVGAARHVWVYGTLRRGGSNDIERQVPPPLALVGAARMQGWLFDLGRYPGLLWPGAAVPEPAWGPPVWVTGEVWAIGPALEQRLDEIEALYPEQTDEYFKRQRSVRLHGGAVLDCIVYEINPAYVSGLPLVPGGDWIAHAGRGHR